MTIHVLDIIAECGISQILLHSRSLGRSEEYRCKGQILFESYDIFNDVETVESTLEGKIQTVTNMIVISVNDHQLSMTDTFSKKLHHNTITVDFGRLLHARTVRVFGKTCGPITLVQEHSCRTVSLLVVTVSRIITGICRQPMLRHSPIAKKACESQFFHAVLAAASLPWFISASSMQRAHSLATVYCQHWN